MDDLGKEGSVVFEPTETGEAPPIRDPREYLNLFYDSPQYQISYDSYFAGKSLLPEVTENQKKKVFLGSLDVEDALFRFYESGERIAWDGTFYTPEIARLWKDYVGMSRDLKDPKLKRSMTREELSAYDVIRSSLHQQMTNALVDEEIVPSTNIGRKLIKLMLVTRGLESMDGASVNSFNQAVAGLGGKIKQSNP